MKYFVYLYLLLISLGSAAQPVIKTVPVPASLYGHWLKTDGSNRFIIGIYPNSVCYENETWRISSAKQIQHRWQLQLENDNSKKIIVTVQRKDSTTLLLDNGAQQELKNTCTFNVKYRPEQPSFQAPLFTAGSALVRGQLHRKEDIRKINYVQLSYTNINTGQSEYLFADLDSLDRFSLRVPMPMPVICRLDNGSLHLGTFLVQPGDTLLLAYNGFIELTDKKQDYNKLMQSVCLMGSDAAFNNQYQYYKRYITSEKDEDSGPVPVQYDSELRKIDSIYPAYAAEQRLIDFVKADTRYCYVLYLLRSHRYGVDSMQLQKIYEQYLSRETPLAFIHTSFYKMAHTFDFNIRRSRDFPLAFQVNEEIMEERLQKDYKPFLTPGFIDTYRKMQQYWRTNVKLSDSVVLQKYFNGNEKEADRFMYCYRQIGREFEKEKYDSAAYGLYARLIPNASIRFALNLQQLQGNSLLGEDIKVPSLYRLAIFNYYSQLPGLPYQQVANMLTANATRMQPAFFDPLAAADIRRIERESEWQKVLKANRGKTVVLMAFNHYFDKENAAQRMYKLKKMQERFRGKIVVFLKYIEPRNRKDWGANLTQYIDFFTEHGQLKDLFYLGGVGNLEAMQYEVIDGGLIFNSSGQAHHPTYFSVSGEQRKKEKLKLGVRNELDSVMAGKGRYYEERAGYYMGGEGPQGKTWTLFNSRDNYFFYAFTELKEPIYALRYDTVLHVLTVKDSLYQESEQILHRLPGTERNPKYSKSYPPAGPACIYRYDRDTRILRIYDEKKNLRKTFSVLFISDYYMELELMQ